MNSKDSLTWNISGHSRTRTHSVDYSRHLSGTSRSRPKAPMDKRPSKSFSDTDAIGLSSRSFHGRYHDLSEGSPKFAKQLANVERAPQTKVYIMDNSFLRKYGNKNEYTLPPTPMHRWVSSPTNSVLSFGMNVDDDTRSFCDSVSSIACSNFANTEVEKERKRRDDSPGKQAKFDAIERWLQHSSRPVL